VKVAIHDFCTPGTFNEEKTNGEQEGKDCIADQYDGISIQC
jgi:hypothetical protein